MTSDKPAVVRIEVNTPRFVFLPPVPGFQTGKKLVPGLNTVEVAYLEALQDHKVPNEVVPGAKATFRFPGRELLEDLQKHRDYHNGHVAMRVPQITIHTDPLAHLEDGPPPPVDLPFNPAQAEAIINHTTNGQALQRWLGQCTDGTVKSLLVARLGLLGVSTRVDR